MLFRSRLRASLASAPLQVQGLVQLQLAEAAAARPFVAEAQTDIAVELQPWKQPLATSVVLHMSVVLHTSQELHMSQEPAGRTQQEPAGRTQQEPVGRTQPGVAECIPPAEELHTSLVRRRLWLVQSMSLVLVLRRLWQVLRKSLELKHMWLEPHRLPEQRRLPEPRRSLELRRLPEQRRLQKAVRR